MYTAVKNNAGRGQRLEFRISPHVQRVLARTGSRAVSHCRAHPHIPPDGGDAIKITRVPEAQPVSTKANRQ